MPIITGNILTFDLAASTGFAVGPPDQPLAVSFGTHVFPSTGDNYGRHQANVRSWLRRLIFDWSPVLIAYEQPSIFNKTTPATIRKLSCYGSTLEEECLKEGFNIPVREINPSTLKKFFTGDGRADKPVMVRTAKRLGYGVANDDEADALAMWFLTVEYYGSEEQKQRFRQMQFEAGMGVAQKAVF